jgi:hypothetical protein
MHAETIKFLWAETLGVPAMTTIGLPISRELTDSIKKSDLCNPEGNSLTRSIGRSIN